MSKFDSMTFDEIYENILWEENANPQDLSELSNSDDVRILRGVAYHKNTLPQDLVKLSRIGDSCINRNLVENTSCPRWLLLKFIASDDEVLGSIAKLTLAKGGN